MTIDPNPTRTPTGWLWPDGTRAPLISGGDGSTDGGEGDGGTGDDTGVPESSIEAATELKALRRENRELRLADAARSVLGRKLADPLDLMRYADDVDQFITDDGKADHDLMTRAADELLESRPYLAASKGRNGAPANRFDGGARLQEPRVTLTRDEIAGMTPQQVAEAIGHGQIPRSL